MDDCGLYHVSQLVFAVAGLYAMSEEEVAAPFSVWVAAIVLVSCIAFGLLLVAGSVDNLISIVN